MAAAPTTRRMSLLPARLPHSIAWELRTAWATGRRVALTLDDRADKPRIEGCVSRVAATGASVHVGAKHVPLDIVLAVHLPSRLGDSTAGESFHGHARRSTPQTEQLFA
jgi:hypothetical protein